MTDLVAGLDEVGMGSLAGPLVVAVAAFPKGKVRIAGVRDSKKCTKDQRERVLKEITEQAGYIGFGYAPANYINEHGVNASWQDAARQALLWAPPFEELIVDGIRDIEDYDGTQRTLPKADILHWEVSAASIVAKVIRDWHMTRLGGYYQAYSWHSNAGYGTQIHRDALQSIGPCPHHRDKYIRKTMREKKRPSRFIGA